MKAIRASNRLFFINLLCLLWLPNYCDIKENEADGSAFQINKIVSSISSETENIPSKQEKENFIEEIAVPVDKLFVKPSVDYVNSVEEKKTETNSNDVKSTQHDQSAEDVTQQVFSNLESSRSKPMDTEDKTPVLNNNLENNSGEPLNEVVEAPSNPEAIKPSLSAPFTQAPSPIKPASENFNKPSATTTQESPQPEKQTQTIEQPVKPSQTVGNSEQPYPIPMNPATEKPVLDGIHQQPHYDGMPSFDEWKKMMLAEQEKGGQKIPSPTPPGKKISSQKRRRNYSSYECGAKIVASNTESEGTGRILNELVDEYMLNPCKAKIWFVIELCETVQATQIELANFELFSSCPREFAVYSSDNFPTRDWVLLGTFTAAELRVLQSFELKQEGFGKFIKIELLSYYGKEHYCPLSVVRIFGTSMVDEYEEMETLASQPPASEDELDRLDIAMEDKKSPNIFNSATDAVINMVKKAAQALGQHQSIDDGLINDTVPDQNNSEVKLCKTMDNSSNKCEDVPLETSKENLSMPQNFSFPPSSMQHSLFRMLHRCDQCAKSRIRYYSSAQPHCRFFQAAFGPVLMQRMCDWLKEHPLVFAHESSAHRKAPAQQHTDTLVISPTKSPPPQIMVIPVDKDTVLKNASETANLTFVSVLESSDVVNATKTSIDVVDVPEGDIESQLEPPILPAQLHRVDDSVVVNGTQNATPEFSSVVLPSPDAINHLPKRPVIIVSEGTNMSTEKSVLQTETTVPDSDPPPTTESVPETEEEQLKEFLPDSVVLVDDLSLQEDLKVEPTEAPTVLKPPDVRSDTEGKFEPVPVSSVVTAGQKESVFMRMSNRIKALELNMSLSSQYLQELSQRYRRQMEDMQRAFNRTIGTLNDTAKKAAERDLKQQEILNTLQLQVANLTQTVDILLNERSSVFREMIETHVCLMVVEAIIMITVMSLCVRRLLSSAARELPRASEQVGSPRAPRLSKRRSSADDSCAPPVARKVKRRSVSEEALHNAGEEPLVIEPPTAFLEPIRAKKKNRKRSRVQRSVSNPNALQVIPTSQCAAIQSLSHSDSCIKDAARSKHQLHQRNHPCENCSDNACTDVKSGEKRRANGTAPLQNLTNGAIPGSRESSLKNQRTGKAERKFSFRKFLRFQKRDSI
ncbi:hypothetical protein JTE90_010139 [Oedothorax gibbosus]|uniref:SUN domain-containing protein n=1 Tax=Oedothorax gibbosus TaxID=931172 RepID=A0AAV6UJH4_9ARAC|nr:hypothetical protein JTE90_010139 [Oedothorax gibbosus]